jgi:hypothetical protein
MSTVRQPLAVRSNRTSRGSTRAEFVAFSPEALGHQPLNANGVTFMPLAKPARPATRRTRLATTLALTGLTLVAVTLLTPAGGFALAQWFAIILTVAAISVYLRRQYARATPHRVS